MPAFKMIFVFNIFSFLFLLFIQIEAQSAEPKNIDASKIQAHHAKMKKTFKIPKYLQMEAKNVLGSNCSYTRHDVYYKNHIIAFNSNSQQDAENMKGFIAHKCPNSNQGFCKLIATKEIDKVGCATCQRRDKMYQTVCLYA